MNNLEIKSSFSSTLGKLEGLLSKWGFKRSGKSFSFWRRESEFRHCIDLNISTNPTYARDSIAHIYPLLRVEIKAVSKLAVDLVKGDLWILANSPETIINIPLENLIPKEKRPQSFAKTKEDFSAISVSVYDCLEKWGLPFLDCYKSAYDVVSEYETGGRPMWAQSHWIIFVVAACLVIGKPELARKIARKEEAFLGKKNYDAIIGSI